MLELLKRKNKRRGVHSEILYTEYNTVAVVVVWLGRKREKKIVVKNRLGERTSGLFSGKIAG